MPSAATMIHRRLDDLDFLAAEQSAFAGVRVEATHRDLRHCDAEPLQCGIGGADRARYIVAA